MLMFALAHLTLVLSVAAVVLFVAAWRAESAACLAFAVLCVLVAIV